MQRAKALTIFEQDSLDTAATRYGTSRDALQIFEGTEGCQNLVYAYQAAGRPLVLRVSYRPDRPLGQIEAELDFISHLADQGVRVARPVPSRGGRLVEAFETGALTFIAVSFERGRGMRVPDNDYRYREGAPIEEYFRDWGRALGQMHAGARTYIPRAGLQRRPDLLELLDFEPVEDRVPGDLPQVRQKLSVLLDELRGLPRDSDGYGLIHGDFNDGNFTVDYSNGDITVFDFDDCCYGWFAYELACAWEGGVGRTMFEPLAERRGFMDRYFDVLLAGYAEHNRLPTAWLDRVPLFLRVVQMQELLYFLQYWHGPDEEIQAGLRYKIRCVVEDIPWLGFFDAIYCPERPFRL
ncbi:MAG: phosphotransferase [Anaerolineae bacterium]|nr:phosphotransferase [Anaerolineae bacterium]